MSLLASILSAACMTVPSGNGATADRPSPAMPKVSADIDWLQMPAGQAIGAVSAVAVDAQDHIWVLHRLASATSADGKPPAPPVLEFDANGRFIRGMGGPGPGYDWPTTEHSLALDRRGHVWVAGSYRTQPDRADDMLLEFDNQGRFIRQIGKRGGSGGDADTGNLHAPADIFIDDAAGEVYVADGYGNRRVIVFDQQTGAFKRMWSAFGKPPPATPAPEPRKDGEPFQPVTGPGPQGFNGVHGVTLSRDGLVYVSDRNNQRIQVFTRSGRYLRQMFVDRNMASAQTASGIAMSADRRQRYLYVADFGNNRVLIYDRARLKLLGSIGGKGPAPCQFTTPHLIATDSRGTLYVAEVQARRVQRLKMEPPRR